MKPPSFRLLHLAPFLHGSLSLQASGGGGGGFTASTRGARPSSSSEEHCRTLEASKTLLLRSTSALVWPILRWTMHPANPLSGIPTPGASVNFSRFSPPKYNGVRIFKPLQWENIKSVRPAFPCDSFKRPGLFSNLVEPGDSPLMTSLPTVKMPFRSLRSILTSSHSLVGIFSAVLKMAGPDPVSKRNSRWPS